MHHCVSLTGASLSIWLGHQNLVLAAACLASELSDIFMNCRWFMLKHQVTDTIVYPFVNLVFMGTFFMCRVLLMLVLLIRDTYGIDLLN